MHLTVAWQDVLKAKDPVEITALSGAGRCRLLFIPGTFSPPSVTGGSGKGGKQWETPEAKFNWPCFSPFSPPLEGDIQGGPFQPQNAGLYGQVPGQALQGPPSGGSGNLRQASVGHLGACMPAIPALKTSSCICVQDSKFPEDKDYILQATKLAHLPYRIYTNKALPRLHEMIYFP